MLNYSMKTGLPSFNEAFARQPYAVITSPWRLLSLNPRSEDQNTSADVSLINFNELYADPFAAVNSLVRFRWVSPVTQYPWPRRLGKIDWHLARPTMPIAALHLASFLCFLLRHHVLLS